METFTIAQTARHLGLSDQGVRKMIGRQELFILPGSDPARLDAAAVETVRLLRRENILHDLARRNRTPAQLARETRRTLQTTATLPDHKAAEQRLRLSLVSAEARQLFGVASLTAACAEQGCRWCLAGEFSRLLGGWAPAQYSTGFAALFGQEPCEVCGPSLYGSVLASLRARVHGDARRPSGPVRRPSAAERQAAAEWAAQRAVTAAAKPAAADDGKAMVSQRLRDVRARLKDARRRGDTQHAMCLQRQLQALTADASVVDGRPVSSRPGTLRCGHALAARCSCPRRSSARSTS